MSTRNTGLRLKVLGTRGSMATNREDQAIFGTATSCYMVRAGKRLCSSMPETAFWLRL